MMTTLNRAIGCALLAACGAIASYASSANGQQLATGSYEGSIEIDGRPISQNPRPRMIYFGLAIKRVEGNSVAGTWSQSGGPCQGEHPVEGRFVSGRLFLKTRDSGSGACRIPPLQLTAGGDALEGAMGQREFRLRR